MPHKLSILEFGPLLLHHFAEVNEDITVLWTAVCYKRSLLCYERQISFCINVYNLIISRVQ